MLPERGPSQGAVLVVCDGSYPIDNKAPGIYAYRNSDSCEPEKGDLRVFDQYANHVVRGQEAALLDLDAHHFRLGLCARSES